MCCSYSDLNFSVTFLEHSVVGYVMFNSTYLTCIVNPRNFVFFPILLHYIAKYLIYINVLHYIAYCKAL